ncbi:NrsF family protein [Mesorhizobium sp. SB112]|uniref:NrsF family protein n=1 Tax=Mesorhizobium sp. SB112 TaxID=3151853 RepID=UPI0032641E19
METSEMIRTLASQANVKPMPMRKAWLVGVALAIFLAAITFTVMLGPRPDFADAAQTVRFLSKFVFALALTFSAYKVLRALARPDGYESGDAKWLLPAPLLLAMAVIFELFAVPQSVWSDRLVGSNSLLCLTLIPFIGIGPLAVFLGVLRHGAPTHPRMAGAFAGLFAGGIAATFYAAHCIDDSPLFVATWYSIAVAILTVAGALIAPRVTRW